VWHRPTLNGPLMMEGSSFRNQSVRQLLKQALNTEIYETRMSLTLDVDKV